MIAYHTCRMAYDQPVTADEFLVLWRQLANNDDSAFLEKLLTELVSMVGSDPDRAVSILQALAHSNDTTDRQCAAIYVGSLFTSRPSQAYDLLSILVRDSDPAVRAQARDTLENVAINTDRLTPTQATRLATGSQK